MFAGEAAAPAPLLLPAQDRPIQRAFRLRFRRFLLRLHQLLAELKLALTAAKREQLHQSPMRRARLRCCLLARHHRVAGTVKIGCWTRRV